MRKPAYVHKIANYNQVGKGAWETLPHVMSSLLNGIACTYVCKRVHMIKGLLLYTYILGQLLNSNFPVAHK